MHGRKFPTIRSCRQYGAKVRNDDLLIVVAKEEIPLDVTTIEYLFSSKQSEQKEKKEEANKPEKRVIVNLLDPKRANHIGRKNTCEVHFLHYFVVICLANHNEMVKKMNFTISSNYHVTFDLFIDGFLGIALGKLKRSFAELKTAIIELNDKLLTVEELVSLRSLLPTSEELTKIREFSGDKKQLDKPEQFIVEIEAIPNLVSRVDNWVFARTFEERAHEVLPQITAVTKAFKQCMSNMKFLKVLQVNKIHKEGKKNWMQE